jgi:hypothetical protein
MFGCKQYGMKRIPVRDAISDIAKIGYEALSLTLRRTWDTESRLLNKTDWAEIRKQIGDPRLVLSSVMEGLRPVGPNTNRESNLQWLRAAAAVAHELSPQRRQSSRRYWAANPRRVKRPSARWPMSWACGPRRWSR